MAPFCGLYRELFDQAGQGGRIGLVRFVRLVPSHLPVGHEAGPDAAVGTLWVFVEDEGVAGGIAEGSFQVYEVGNHQFAGCVVATEVDGDGVEARAGVDRCTVFDEIRSGSG